MFWQFSNGCVNFLLLARKHYSDLCWEVEKWYSGLSVREIVIIYIKQIWLAKWGREGHRLYLRFRIQLIKVSLSLFIKKEEKIIIFKVFS